MASVSDIHTQLYIDTQLPYIPNTHLFLTYRIQHTRKKRPTTPPRDSVQFLCYDSSGHLPRVSSGKAETESAYLLKQMETVQDRQRAATERFTMLKKYAPGHTHSHSGFLQRSGKLAKIF